MTIQFKITEMEPPGKKFVATVLNNPESIFGGDGDTWAEAIGQCVISNRETLDITFDVHELNGDVLRSKVYGKSRK